MLESDEEEYYDSAAEDEIGEFERILWDVERVSLRIKETQNPLSEKNLSALKRLLVINEDVESILKQRLLNY